MQLLWRVCLKKCVFNTQMSVCVNTKNIIIMIYIHFYRSYCDCIEEIVVDDYKWCVECTFHLQFLLDFLWVWMWKSCNAIKTKLKCSYHRNVQHIVLDRQMVSNFSLILKCVTSSPKMNLCLKERKTNPNTFGKTAFILIDS